MKDERSKVSAKTIILIAVLLLLLTGIPVGIFLLRQTQEIREEAAVPAGEARVSMAPATATHPVGETFPVSISFTTQNIPISAIAVRITYSYTGTAPEVTASNIEVSPALTQTGDWSCPVKTITPVAGKVQIDLACVNLSTQGYIASSDTLLATFNLTGNQVPVINPVVLTFDRDQSIITRKTDAQDILLIPTSTGSYTIASVGGDGVPSSTPSPTPTTSSGASPTPTSLTPSPTGIQGATNTPTSTGSATPTGGTPLPETGVSLPMVFALGVGALLLVGAIFLAF
ncbi:hypothetical protein HY008_00570 [Candidatus Woesebacteria bacterium]|nr:hypothetical protein [Candidatus Woesebacteria bacterium]